MSHFNFIKPIDKDSKLFIDELLNLMMLDIDLVSNNDCITLIKILKENNYSDLNICFQLVKKINSETVSNNFGWLVYQQMIKFCPSEITKFFDFISGKIMSKFKRHKIQQKDKRKFVFDLYSELLKGEYTAKPLTFRDMIILINID